MAVMHSRPCKDNFRAVVCWSLVIASYPLQAQVKPRAGGQHRQTTSDIWVLREDGIGPVNVGMTIAELSGVLGEKLSMPDSKEEEGCFYLDSMRHPHVHFMMEDGRLARIDVNEAGVATAEGIQVGDSEARALRVYGSRVKTEPHAYTAPDGHYLTVRSRSGRYGMRFETYKGKIESFYAGRFSAIQYIDGCL